MLEFDSIVSDENDLRIIAEVLLVRANSGDASSFVVVHDFETQEPIVGSGSVAEEDARQRPIHRHVVSRVAVDSRRVFLKIFHLSRKLARFYRTGKTLTSCRFVW